MDALTFPPKKSFLLLQPYVFIFFLGSILHRQCMAEREEGTKLLQLKLLLNTSSIPNWTSNSSSSSHYCKWPEIICDHHNQVTGILLSDKNISVSIPPLICSFNSLTHLDLSYNYIPGPFPLHLLHHCANLLHLDLSQNYFVHPIPAAISNLSLLSHLDLSSNNFSGQIPPTIANLTHLKFLNLQANLFTAPIPPDLGFLPKLRRLSISYLQSAPASVIPANFGLLKRLKVMSMTSANLVGSIPATFSNLSSVEMIDLSRNSIHGSVPEGLFLLPNIEDLYIYKNYLTGTIPQKLECFNIVNMDLSYNRLTGSIPFGFENLKKLQSLSFSSNGLSGEIPKGVGLLPNLSEIILFFNNLTGILPPELGLHSNFTVLDIAHNSLTGELPRHLCKGGYLYGVSAFSNMLTGNIPPSLNSCTSLNVLFLQDNRLSGEIPEMLYESENMTMLKLSDNSFSGKIHPIFGKNLRTVEISNNKMSGGIPTRWRNIVVLRASNNMLSGHISVEATSLQKLTVLELDGNRLSGHLPEVLLSWRSLVALNLSRNNFSGQIPEALFSLPALSYLDLSENQFSGQIKMHQAGLSVLNLSSNMLSGRVPPSFQNDAFSSSFLNNQDLCADDIALHLRQCSAGETSTRPRKRSRRKLTVILIVVMALAFVIVVMSIITGLIKLEQHRRRRRRMQKEGERGWKMTTFQRLSFGKSAIISQLSAENIVGRGGSGEVYRIEIRGGDKTLAAKRIYRDRVGGIQEKQFDAEVKTLGSIRHSNIVKLMCCIKGEESMIVVYEYMENQSLDMWIHGERSRVLDWETQLRIAKGAAEGLCHLHHGCSPAVVHMDVKPTNILLDSSMNPKIADFGLARVVFRPGEENTLSVVAGTFGYMAPEVVRRWKVSEKADVYSFGVVLLEMVTGKKPAVAEEEISLVEWARRRMREDGSVEGVVAGEMAAAESMAEIRRVVEVGMACTVDDPTQRPVMREVLVMLQHCSRPRLR